MKKREFDKKLLDELGDMPYDEKAKIIAYYNELYMDKCEAGITEDEIIESFGTPELVAARVLSDGQATPFSKRVKQIKEKSVGIFKNKTFLTIYFSLFFITIPLTIAAFSVVFCLIVAVGAIFFSVYAVAFAFALAGIVGGVYSVVILFSNFATGMAALGICLVLISLAIFCTQIIKAQNKLIDFAFRKKNKQRQEKPRSRTVKFMFSTVLAFVVLIVGSVCFTTGLGAVGWNFAALDNQTYEAVTFNGFDDSVKSIKIDATSGDFIIRQAQDDNYRVDYYKFDNRTITISFEHDQLYIKETRKNQWFDLNMFGIFNYNKQKVYVYVPAVLAEDCTLNVTSGDIDIKGIEFEGKLIINATSGDIKLNNVIADKISVTCTSGNISGKTVAAESIYVKLTSGEINLNKLNINSAEFKTTSGDIRIGFTAVKSEFKFTISKLSGDSNVSSGGNGAKTVYVKVTSGDIRFTFNS